MNQSTDELRANLMRMELEELEERLHSKSFTDEAEVVAREVIQWKKDHPEPPRPRTNPTNPRVSRIVAAVLIALISLVYFWLKSKSKGN